MGKNCTPVILTGGVPAAVVPITTHFPIDRPISSSLANRLGGDKIAKIALGIKKEQKLAAFLAHRRQIFTPHTGIDITNFVAAVYVIQQRRNKVPESILFPLSAT